MIVNRRDLLKAIAGATCASAAINATAKQGDSQSSGKPSIQTKGDIQFWLASSLNRVYGLTKPEETDTPGDAPIILKAGRNYRLSFQACFRNLSNTSAVVQCKTSLDARIQSTVRRVGSVPMQQLDTFTPLTELDGIGKIPGLCPDPLYPEKSAHIGPMATGIFWISLIVPENVSSGKYSGKVQLSLDNRFGYAGWDNPEKFSIELPFEVQVSDIVVPKRKMFPATLWLSGDSIWEYYKIEPFSDRFWALADAYIKNLVEHGINVIYTPIFNIRAEKLKRPAQLLKVHKTTTDQYEFDFSDVRRWIQLARKNGAEFVEFSHFFSPAPESAAYPQKIYERKDALGELLWPENTAATSDTYRKFLNQFLPPFKKMLEEEKMQNNALFHLADEPDGADAIRRYREARNLLREMAPWIKVMDAMSDPHFATDRLSDMPIPSIVTANQFAKAGCPAWVYYCCGPRDGYIQRLLDTPLWKIRMSGWLFYKLKAQGFLHWGYNYWFKFCTDQIADPFADATNGAWPGMPYGDTFAVYPGADGPIDSIRWELFAESLQDYALLQAKGISPDDEILSELKDYNDFPKNDQWIKRMLDKLLV